MSKRKRSDKVILRPATRDDIETFYPDQKKPSLRAMCMEIDGYIVGIGGVALKDGRWFAFTDLADEARERKIVLGRAAKRFFQDLKRDGIANVFAEKNNSEATAERWLASLGFEQVNGNVYRWRG